MKNPSSFWPISVESCLVQVIVTRLEEEMVCDQLLLLLFTHGLEGIILAFEFWVSYLGQCSFERIFNLVPLVSFNECPKWISLHISCNSDSRGETIFIIKERGIKVQFFEVPIRDMFLVRFVAVVDFNNWVHEFFENSIALLTSEVDSDSALKQRILRNIYYLIFFYFIFNNLFIFFWTLYDPFLFLVYIN